MWMPVWLRKAIFENEFKAFQDHVYADLNKKISALNADQQEWRKTYQGNFNDFQRNYLEQQENMRKWLADVFKEHDHKKIELPEDKSSIELKRIADLLEQRLPYNPGAGNHPIGYSSMDSTR